MSKKRYQPEQIVTLLRQIEVEIANGKTTPQACRGAQITEQTYYRWQMEYGGFSGPQGVAAKCIITYCFGLLEWRVSP